MKKIYPALVLSLLMAVSLIRGAEHYDVVVYGGTPGGIASAVSAAREGASVILLEQTNHVGGLSTSGLNRDEGEHMVRWTLGGFSERFTREAAMRSGTDPNVEGARKWVSGIAEEVFLEMLEKQNIPIVYGQLIERVEMDGQKIKVLKTRGGNSYLAKIFIDATYEGDLLAAAGVSYT
ncbi:MAG: FAD-dependent oxidoreductase, partial [Opitutaceae bacterium]|nr:FAD-dependent oxidoreductase [Opitutaceae bacterium]